MKITFPNDTKGRAHCVICLLDSWGNSALLHQVDELLMRVNVQLAVDVGDVRLHCAVREGEFLLDVSSVAAACQQAQHIGFTRGEAVFAGELYTKSVQA